MSSMTIIGLGIDATEIPRIAETMKNYGDRFLQRIFTPGEIGTASRSVTRRSTLPHASP